MTAITRITGAISAYGAAVCSNRPLERRRRRDACVPAAMAVEGVSCNGYDWLSTEAMLSLAEAAACLTVSFPLRI